MSGLWRHGDFLRLWAGESVSDLGTAISIVVLPLIAVVYLDATPTEVGALAALEWLPWLLIGLPAGVWVDRSRKRRLMFGSNAVRALVLATVPIAAAADVLSIGQLLAVAFVTGVATRGVPGGVPDLPAGRRRAQRPARGQRHIAGQPVRRPIRRPGAGWRPRATPSSAVRGARRRVQLRGVARDVGRDPDAGTAPAWVLLGGNVLSALVLVVSPLRTMRDLPSSPEPVAA